MKVLITGGSGFIGKNVQEYIQKFSNYEVMAPNSRELDCLDEQAVTEFLQDNNFDYVLHFAVYGDGVDKSKDGTRMLDYNLRIFWNFAKNKAFYGKMFYTGSGAEYDKRYDISSVKEDDIGKSIPIDAYGLMKYSIGRVIECSDNIYNLRLFGIFGKYEYYPIRFISNVCCKAIQNMPLTMRQNVYFDYLWVDDFCRMLLLMMQGTPKYHTYNVVSGQRISLKEICDIVLKISGKKLPIVICRKGFNREYTASNERFRQEYAEFSYTPIQDAIEQLYHWYETQNIDMYKLLY